MFFDIALKAHLETNFPSPAIGSEPEKFSEMPE